MSVNAWLEDDYPTPLPPNDDQRQGPTPVAAGGRPNWPTVILLCITVLFGVLWWRSRESVDPGPEPIPGPDTNNVLVFTDVQNTSQLTAAGSSLLDKAAIERGFEFRRFDKGNATWSNVEPIWRIMRDNAKPPPSITVYKKGDLKSYAAPTSVEEAVSLIK